MATEKAPVELTGGAGHEFEDSVAARFLIDLLAARCALGVALGQVVRLSWQARESGWLADDLLISCKLGTRERSVALSVKSDRQVTKTGFPDDLTRLAWEQWLGQAGAVALKGTGNAIGLVVGHLAAGVEEAWNKICLEVRESRSNLGRVLARLKVPTTEDPGSQSSEVQRALVASLNCPAALAQAGATTNLETLELISQLHLLYLDFRSPSSRQEGLALADCRALLVSGDDADAQRLWAFLLGLAGRKRSNGGTATLPEVLAELRPHFALRVHPDFDADWRSLERHTREAMDLVSNEIYQLGSLARSDEQEKIRTSLREGKITVLVGSSGVGKSGLAKNVALEGAAAVCWFSDDALDFASTASMNEHLGLRHPLDAILAAASARCTVVFDGVEKVQYPRATVDGAASSTPE